MVSIIDRGASMCTFVVGLGEGKSTAMHNHRDLSEVCSGSMPSHTNWWLRSPDSRNNFRSRQGWVFPLSHEF